MCTHAMCIFILCVYLIYCILVHTYCIFLARICTHGIHILDMQLYEFFICISRQYRDKLENVQHIKSHVCKLHP